MANGLHATGALAKVGLDPKPSPSPQAAADAAAIVAVRGPLDQTTGSRGLVSAARWSRRKLCFWSPFRGRTGGAPLIHKQADEKPRKTREGQRGPKDQQDRYPPGGNLVAHVRNGHVKREINLGRLATMATFRLS
jgi:hypothetical protein